MPLQTVTIADLAAGSSATILVGLGFNCFSFRAVCDGEAREMLWAAPDFASGRERPSGSGIPILFPFPGRIRGTRFQFAGRDFTLAPGDALGNAIHGFVYDRPWRLTHSSPRSATGEFQASRDDPSILEHWPADFRISVTYELSGNRLTSDVVIENPDQRPLPFGFGTHPYFRLPLLSGGRAEACRVTVPAHQIWERRDMLPTGRVDELPAGPDTLQSGMRFGDMKFDDVFGGLDYASTVCTTSIQDATAAGGQRAVQMRFGQEFSACVIYNPPHREAVCIEPYTCVPDPITLESAGIKSGLRVLAPGENFQSRVTIEVV